jgi:hypothetical protein
LSGFMKVKSYFLRLGKFKLRDSTQIRFWEDVWLGDFAFKSIFSTLYDIVRKKSATVASILQSNPLNISFRRHLVGINLIAWQRLMAKVSKI